MARAPAPDRRPPRARERDPQVARAAYRILGGHPNVVLLDPLAYVPFVDLMRHCRLIITDSGGIQEETTCLGVPCVTVRENTERPITVTCGTNTIAGTQSENIREAVKTQRHRPANGSTPEKWDGKAGARIIGTIIASTKRGRNR